jgi:hypothetical protein
VKDKDDRAANITPDSRVGELLERWPHLEDVLIELSPRYRALKNPVSGGPSRRSPRSGRWRPSAASPSPR